MEVEYCTEPCSSIGTLHEKETLIKNETVTGDLKTRVNGNQLKNESSHDIINNETLVSNMISTINSTDLQTSSSSVHDTTVISEYINLAKPEAVGNNTTNVTESENLNSNNAESNPSFFQYNWSITPRLLCLATEEYEPTNLCENFTKGCQWSPDGSCLLVSSEDFRIRIYELPRELFSGKLSSNFMETNFMAALIVKEGGLVYDICWYPFMNSWDPETCCFLSTSKESPVHLWDAVTGALRATYRAYNQVDEVEASISIQFINSGNEIWCGFKNAVRIFDTDRPGRQKDNIHFKNDFPNMRGLVSCIRENPIMPGLVAFGSYSNCIGLYKNGPLCTFKTSSGVTQVEFSSCGTKLFSAVRRKNEFLCWDLRNPGVVLHSFEGRQSNTNQRIQFAMTPDNKQIISGGIDGNIIVWESQEESTNLESLNPKYKIKLSKDCINGTSLHKSLPILATSSGQRHCDIQKQNRDNSVRLWWIS